MVLRRSRRLRLCAPAALDDDPLRVLRLARLARGLGFVPDAAATEAAFRAAAGLAGRQRRAATGRALGATRRSGRAGGLRDLAVWGALRVVLPELDGLRGVEQNPYHHLDVFEHTMEALTYVRGVVEQLGGPAHLASAGRRGGCPAPRRSCRCRGPWSCTTSASRRRAWSTTRAA